MKKGFMNLTRIRCEREVEKVIETKNGNKQRIVERRRLTPLEFIFQTLGVAGILAILIFSTICTIVLTQSLNGQEVKIPPFFTEFATLIIGYYFGQKAHGSDASSSEKNRTIGF